MAAGWGEPGIWRHWTLNIGKHPGYANSGLMVSRETVDALKQLEDFFRSLFHVKRLPSKPEHLHNQRLQIARRNTRNPPCLPKIGRALRRQLLSGFE